MLLTAHSLGPQLHSEFWILREAGHLPPKSLPLTRAGGLDAGDTLFSQPLPAVRVCVLSWQPSCRAAGRERTPRP